MSFSVDTFTDTSATDLALHTEDSGGSWTLHGSYGTGAFVISNANRARANNSNTAVYYTSESPASADYTVQADLVVLSNAGTNGVAFRIQTGSNNMYFQRYRQAVGLWELGKVISGTTTVLASASATLSVSSVYTHSGGGVGSALTGTATGIGNLTATDSAITLAGRAGMRGLSGSDTTGYHLDNFSGSDPAAASSGLVKPRVYLSTNQSYLW